MGNKNPVPGIQATGISVLEFYNSRIDEAHEKLDHIRSILLFRYMATQEFAFQEGRLEPLVTSRYRKARNDNGNYGVWHEEGRRAFTWQPQGAQFTVVERLPAGASLYRIDEKAGEVR